MRPITPYKVRPLAASLLLLTLIGLLLFSCQQKPSFSYTLTLTMSEQLTDTGRSLLLHFESNDFHEKAGFRLTSQVAADPATHKIQIALTAVSNTPPSNAPLETTAPLNHLAPGNYQLNITLMDKEISGQLTVDSIRYRISLQDNTSIQVATPGLNQLPQYALYGTVHYNRTDSAPIVNDFLSKLRQLGATTRRYHPGNYGQFQIGDDGQIEQKQDSDYPFTRYFIYQYTGDIQAVKDLIEKYGFEHTTELLITAHTYDGKLINLWSVKEVDNKNK